ncbi:SNF2 family N-terminal domain-containing protein [Morchella snyderi]|nr:SNF2 family N-terminal domain-containing protein [Morchella snyderi]
MYSKRFVPPLLRKPTAAPEDADEPPNKKTRLTSSSSALTISTAHMPQRVAQTLKLSTASNTPARKPLLLVRNPVLSPAAATTTTTATTTSEDGNDSTDQYYNVLWRKKTTKKHKTFDGDGILALSGGYATLQDSSGKDLGRTMMRVAPALGGLLSLGGKDVEIDSVLSRADYLAGRPFLKAAPAKEESAASFQAVSAAGFFGHRFKTPLLGSTPVGASHAKVPTPRHDPNAEGALVMPRPPPGSAGAGKSIVDVVVDPFVSCHLRPHQREGVQFLYEAVMGYKAFNGQGAILADEMGLGKTLQTIALLWTLLKQNPVFGSGAVVRKALIVCPVTLINNWRKEFVKWLGRERIGVFVADSKANVRDFTHGRVYSVMIVGYERLQKLQAELRGADIDIVVADEGHRLKTEKNKSAAAIRGLNTKRRVILSGTPLQNDLHEFYIMVDFVNPGLLESYQTFRKEFENPIVKSRQPGSSKKDVEKGKARGDELARITKLFVLRRTAEILSSYLPPKTEYIVFCRPTPKQVKVYTTILSSPHFESCYRSPDTSLLLITLLKKLCNSPGLLAPKPSHPHHPTTQALLASVHPKLLESHSSSHSGKFRVLDRLLLTLYRTTAEKVVVISNYTSTLDLLSTLLSSRGLPHTRLDGTTPQSRRQDIIDAFNRASHRTTFALLLSAKSGGAGINLTGASRLVLFDLDWNPATDAQAMARVHRDGQARPVVIYRLVTAGTVEEKMLQRQAAKTGLAASVVDMRAGVGSFSADELRDLFSLTATECGTHELMACPCAGRGYVAGGGGVGEEEEEEGGEEGEEEEEEEEMRYPGLMKASEVDIEKIERERLAALKRVPKGQLGALMEYSHVLASRLVRATAVSKPADGEEAEEEEGEEEEEEYDEVSIEDELLTQVVRDGMGKEVSFIFQKTF